MDRLEKQIYDLIGEEVGIDSGELSPEIRLTEDLHLDGADASVLLEKFFKRFDVDYRSFQFERHFGAEAGPMPWTPLVWVYNLLLYGKVAPGLQTLTIEMLIESANTHVWRDWHCAKCNYDCRGIDDCCPECGSQLHGSPVR